MSASTGWEASHELSRATDHWTLPVVTRRYPDDASAGQRIAREAAILEAHGYKAAQRRVDGAGSTPTPGASIGEPGDPAGGRVVVTYHLS